MGNKILCVLMLCLCGLYLSAATQKNSSKRKTQKTKTESVSKKDSQKNSGKTKKKTESKKTDGMPKQKVDLKKPFMTEEQIQSMLEGQIRNKVLKADLPHHLKETGKNQDMLNTLRFNSVLLSYDRMIKDPEFPEVTRHQLGWYQKLAQQLSTLKSAVQKMDNGVFLKDEKLYLAGREEYEQNVKEIEQFMTKEKPVKLSPEAWKKLHVKNIQMRTLQYKQYLQAKAAADAAAAKKKAAERRARAQGKSGK